MPTTVEHQLSLCQLPRLQFLHGSAPGTDNMIRFYGIVVAEPVVEQFQVTADGHFVGKDGFVVPRDFGEFYERFPRYIKQFVSAFMRNNTGGDCDDLEGDLILFLLTIPPDSKYRLPGCNGLPNGCTDRLQMFNPRLSFGCSMARWKSWLNRCLRNQLLHLLDKSAKNPILRHNTVAIVNEHPGVSNASRTHLPIAAPNMKVNEDFVRKPRVFMTTCRDAVTELNKEVFIRQFLTFVTFHNPELVPVMETLEIADSCGEAQVSLGLSKRIFNRHRSRLCVLAKSFLNDTAPPKQRKFYYMTQHGG